MLRPIAQEPSASDGRFDSFEEAYSDGIIDGAERERASLAKLMAGDPMAAAIELGVTVDEGWTGLLRRRAIALLELAEDIDRRRHIQEAEREGH